MKVEQPMLRSTLSGPKMDEHRDNIYTDHSINSSRKRSSLESFNGLSHPSESFKMQQMGVGRSDPAEKKYAWLRSEMIGGDAEIDTPFGKRMLTYADHTASGRCLHYIENYIINFVLPFYGNTHTCDSFVGQRMTKMVHEATEYIKSCLGGGPDDALLFCGSGTTAAIKRLQEVMGIAVPSTLRDRIVKSLSSEERWVVFVGPYEHHSNLLSWRQSLAEVVEIGIDDDGLVDIEALKLQLESYKCSNRPLLGSFSACSNVTGIYSDTNALARLLHQYGAFACFDFAASGPYIEIDMRSGDVEGYDAIFLSTHKFLGGPQSPGILLMSKALYQLRTSPPSTCGGGTVCFVNGFNEQDTLYYDDIEEREDAGTPPIIQKIRAALAFWVKEFVGYEPIEKQERIYIDTALKRLLPNPNILVLGNTSAKRQAILSFLVFSTTNSSSADTCNNDSREPRLYMWGEYGNQKDKPLHGAFVAKLLNDLFGIQARGGCACAGPYGHHLLGVDEPRSLAFRSAISKGYVGVKPGWTRISFSYYMANEEFEFILAALEFIAIYGQRFLQMYHFNWKTGNWSSKKGTFKENLVGMEQTLGFSDLSLASAKQEINLDKGSRNCNDVSKYLSYLEIAKRIANSLPKFPPQRKVPKDIDLNLLQFRV
ncbi:hypothetical protein HHK36_007920 [Tetracentron sinense]|uniref:Aminotransferase class V domain-containing protein n=1 Tax=Tetracentron sinense TaxID=13715 RepID=A0A835DIT5_TETSI|nr:hypothetical protein HHK36_007920 [Tetracentron sinense]